jgi:hypothetical protein
MESNNLDWMGPSGSNLMGTVDAIIVFIGAGGMWL